MYLAESLADYPELHVLITGLIVILIIRFAPFGIWGVIKLIAGKFVKQKAPTAVGEEAQIELTVGAEGRVVGRGREDRRRPGRLAGGGRGPGPAQLRRPHQAVRRRRRRLGDHPGGAQGRGARRHRPERRRQEHARRHAERRHPRHLRHRLVRRPGRLAHAVVQARPHGHRPHAPDPQAVPADDRAREPHGGAALRRPLLERRRRARRVRDHPQGDGPLGRGARQGRGPDAAAAQAARAGAHAGARAPHPAHGRDRRRARGVRGARAHRGHQGAAPPRRGHRDHRAHHGRHHRVQRQGRGARLRQAHRRRPGAEGAGGA